MRAQPRLSLLAAAACLAACASEAPGSDALPIRDGERATAFPAAALLEARQGPIVGDCSAAVIAPRVVLTAGHCVHGFARWVVTAPYAAGQRGESEDAETFDWNVPHEAPNPELHDIGLVYLAEPIVLERYPSLVGATLEAGTAVRYIGRVDDGDVSQSELFVGAERPLRPGSDFGWPHTYATAKYAEQGDSGGPVVLADDDGMTIAGVDSGGNDALDVELFARMDELSGWIGDRLAAHPAD